MHNHLLEIGIIWHCLTNDSYSRLKRAIFSNVPTRLLECPVNFFLSIRRRLHLSMLFKTKTIFTLDHSLLYFNINFQISEVEKTSNRVQVLHEILCSKCSCVFTMLLPVVRANTYISCKGGCNIVNLNIVVPTHR